MPNESKPNRKVSEHLRVCPVRGVIDVISKKWAFLIINALGNSGKLRFNALMETLEGVSPKTLSDTLKMLEKEGFVRKESFNEIPPRVEYSLTKDGMQFRKAIVPLLQWAAKRSRTQGQKCELECHNKSVGKTRA